LDLCNGYFNDEEMDDDNKELFQGKRLGTKL